VLMLPRADLTLLRCQFSSRPWLASATNTNGRAPIATLPILLASAFRVDVERIGAR
jgi:hypothetical protein